ncbi:hypothetical protein VAE308_1080085 [Vibrio aestuarianus]|nr:hypothetical protein VAE308_1080085 [Vibrio aestuarianus]CAH8215600.1 hypothetical protein VIBAE_A40207 [Vibrio aestuarianus subsp. francensis]CAH8216961.1 hypothetical protein VAE032_300085 [Vibrio aestuarianus]
MFKKCIEIKQSTVQTTPTSLTRTINTTKTLTHSQKIVCHGDRQ